MRHRPTLLGFIPVSESCAAVSDVGMPSECCALGVATVGPATPGLLAASDVC